MSLPDSNIKTWARHQKPVSARLTKEKQQPKKQSKSITSFAASPLIQAHLTQTHQQSRLSISAATPKQDTSSEQPFPFLDLPAEIRLMIYGYAVTESEPIYLDTLAAPPALTRVCRQIRQEALPVFLGANSFVSLFSAVTPISQECTEPCCVTTYTTSFSPATESWLCTLPPSQPLIRDISFALQPSDWDSDCELSPDFRMREGRLAHGPDCPFCVDGFYGNVLPLSVSHPAVPQSLKLLLPHAQRIHDAELDAANAVLRFSKGLSLYDIIAFTKAFVGSSEIITARMCDQQRMVEYFKESLCEWDNAKSEARFEIQRDLQHIADDLWNQKEKWCGSM